MEIHFEINHECLLFCRHCSSLAEGGGEKMHYTPENMIRFLSLFSQEKHVFITGGEPLLYDGLDSILSYLTGGLKNLSIGLFTTGIVRRQGELCAIPPEQARRLAGHGLKTCYFSLYAPSAPEHNWMTGVEGSFDMTLESIKNMEDQGIETKLNLVVTQKNKDKLRQMIAVASHLGCTEVRLLKLICHGRATQCWPELGLTEEEYHACVMDALSYPSPIAVTASSCIDLLPCRPFHDAQGCQAGSRLAYVTIDGDVYPCASMKNCPQHKIGGIEEIERLGTYFARQTCPSSSALCAVLSH